MDTREGYGYRLERERTGTENQWDDKNKKEKEEKKKKKRRRIFFFKQKTAYEIYQCDWSSDVCSSDLLPFPGINQDNLPFFVPIATQARGETFIHDWTYEERAIYFPELNKLGAQIKLIDNHRVTISGPSKLKAAELICPPALRPAVIILVAMLGASGKSILRNIYPIHRGYEKLEQRLTWLGADIKLEE